MLFECILLISESLHLSQLVLFSQYVMLPSAGGIKFDPACDSKTHTLASSYPHWRGVWDLARL